MACKVVLKDGTEFIAERKFTDVMLYEGLFENVYRVTQTTDKFTQGQLVHVPHGSINYTIPLEDGKEK